MTFVGKILVIVILAFALFFLALSTVVFTASTNWRTEYEALQERSQELQQQITQAQNELQALEASKQEEIERRDATIARLEASDAQLNQQIATLEDSLASARTAAEQAQRTSQTLAQEAQARATEAEQLREQFEAAQKQANDYAARQSQLNEQIFTLERQLETAERNNEDLRTALANYQNYLESRGLPSDPERVRLAAEGTIVSPDIEGRVLNVHRTNDLIEFSLGEDDGVVTGQEYFVFRTGDSPQYIGKVRVTLTEPDKSVGRVIDRYLGRKVREGDHVSAKIRPRS